MQFSLRTNAARSASRNARRAERGAERPRSSFAEDFERSLRLQSSYGLQ